MRGGSVDIHLRVVYVLEALLLNPVGICNVATYFFHADLDGGVFTDTLRSKQQNKTPVDCGIC